MSTSSSTLLRSTNLISKLDGARETDIIVDSIPAIVEFSYHGQKRGKEREVIENAMVYMIQRAFHSIIDLKHGERFLLTDRELDMSLVGGIHADGTDIIISIISTVDSAFVHNPFDTLEIAI